MKTLFAAAAALPILLAAGTAFAGDGDDLPPNALPGHCYQHFMTPAVTEPYQERVIDIPAHQVTRTIPAVYGDVEKQVLVEPGRVEHHWVAPTYKTVTETETVRPEITRDEVIPAEYDVVHESVLVREAHTEWRRGYGPVSDPDMPRYASDRDVVCLVEVPAEYRRETRRVLRSPERVEHITTPAITRTVTREVIDQPGRDEVREIAPVYRKVRERVVIQPERVETYAEGAVYRVVPRTRVVTPGHLEWRELECRKVRHHPHPRPPENDGERG